MIGTITLVVMKGDERTGYYRQRANNLKQYSKVNNVPKVRWDVPAVPEHITVLQPPMDSTDCIIAIAAIYQTLYWVPQKLQNSMQDHLRLHFNNEEASDEQVTPTDLCTEVQIAAHRACKSHVSQHTASQLANSPADVSLTGVEHLSLHNPATHPAASVP
jgi:hypothetical protein